MDAGVVLVLGFWGWGRSSPGAHDEQGGMRFEVWDKKGLLLARSLAFSQDEEIFHSGKATINPEREKELSHKLAFRWSILSSEHVKVSTVLYLFTS